MLPDVVVLNLHRRYTGVSATVKALLPRQRQTLAIGLWDQGNLELPDRLGLWALLRWGWTSPHKGPWRVWHARRDNELLLGLVLRSLLRQPWQVIFTSAAPKRPGWWLRQSIRCTDLVIATSPRSAGFLERCDAVIFHGVDCEQFQPAANREAALAEVGMEGLKCIASFGRIRPSKGTDLLVEALVALLPQFPGWVGVITGLCQRRDQAYLAALRRQIALAGLEQRIHFVGDLDPVDIRRWYQRASICVAASRREGFGLTPLEAMASGCVPVTSQAGAWPWIVRPEFGLIFENGDHLQLAAALRDLMSDEGRLQAMSAKARMVALQEFSIEEEAAQINSLYSTSLTKSRGQQQ